MQHSFNLKIGINKDTSDVFPIEVSIFLYSYLSKHFSSILLISTTDIISKRLIFSTPAPIPQSINPALILAAMVAHASKPLPQNLLIVETGTDKGMPAYI